jgi:hypothetical protein
MALSQQSILGSFLPTVYISKITLHNTRVDLEMVIIDTAENDSLTLFMNDQFLRNCVVIKAYQSTGSADTIELERGNTVSGITERIIPLQDTTYTEIDEKNNRKFYYNLSYDIELDGLEHLSYVVYSDINIGATNSPFDAELTRLLNTDEIPKKITTEIVIDNYEIVSKSYVYLLADGSVWDGEVVFNNNNYTSIEDQPRELNRIQVETYKIQDFRIRREAQDTISFDNFSLAAAEATSINITQAANIAANVSTPAKYASVSKIVNNDRSVSISILMNIQQIVFENCLYPGLLRTDMYNDTSLINGMSLLRRKIKGIVSNSNKTFIDTEENTEPVLISSDFINAQTAVVSSGKHFLINDNSMADITAGIYQYGINIKINDPTIRKMKDLLLETISIRKDIEEYYKFCDAYTDANTGRFKNEVRDSKWKIIEITNYVERYIRVLFSLHNSATSPNFFNNLRTSLITHISPIDGSLEGVSLFIKMLDDIISDTSKILSITNISNEMLQLNQENLNSDPEKSLVEIVSYFPQAIHDANQTNKLQINYFDEVGGVVEATQFNSRLYPDSNNNDELYIAPSGIYIGSQQINFADLDINTTDVLKKQKYLLLKNKILNVENNKDLYPDPSELRILINSNNPGRSENTRTALTNAASNNLIDQYLFSANSVTFDQSPTGSSRTDKLNGLNKVLFPQNVIKISSSIDVNILKDKVIDLNNDEDLFKYRLLNKVLYAEYNSSENTIVWTSLTIDKITQMSQRSGTVDKLLCMLEPYDYAQIPDAQIKNVNEFDYNKTFVLNLQNFDFVRQQQTSPIPTTKTTTTTQTTTTPTQTITTKTTTTQTTITKTETAPAPATKMSLAIIADTKILNFPTTSIGNSSAIEFAVKLIGTGRDDLYCFIEDNKLSSYFKISPSTFSLVANDEKQILKIAYIPKEPVRISTNLIIATRKSGIVLRIPITANNMIKS